MNMDDIELKLLMGMPIHIDGVGDIYSPLLNDIIELGFSKYNEFLTCLLVDNSIIKRKTDNEKDETVDTFSVILSLMIHDQSFYEKFKNALELTFREKVSFGHTDEEAFFYVGDLSKQRFITDKNIELIQAIVRIANQVKTQNVEEEYNPADEQTRKIIEEMLARRKKKPKPKSTMNMHSIISGLASKSNSINHFNIGGLSVYQLYDSFHRLEVIENYHYTMVGIYTGNVDSKKINYNKMHWSKIIDHR